MPDGAELARGPVRTPLTRDSPCCVGERCGRPRIPGVWAPHIRSLQAPNPAGLLSPEAELRSRATKGPWCGSQPSGNLRSRHLGSSRRSGLEVGVVADWAGADGKAFRELTNQEIAGKNAAIHSYDKTIWAVRSGYLTVVFVTWSLALTSLVGESGLVAGAVPLTYLLAGLTVSLSLGGWTLDHSYVRRKFRVIMALDDLIQVALRVTTQAGWQPDGDEWEELTRLLRVSGDWPGQPYLQRGPTKPTTRLSIRAGLAPVPVEGFRQALFPALVIYIGLPIVFTALALAATYLVPTGAIN